MKKVSAIMLITILFVISSCAALGGINVLAASSKINNTGMSEENRLFQQNSEINLTYTLRSLWSIQDSSKNKVIKLYFNSILENQLTYSINNDQKEIVSQTIVEDQINISVNITLFQNYTDLEKSLLLAVSTASLALLQDEKTNSEQIPNMFIKFIDDWRYDGLVNTQWYKEKAITLTDNGIILSN